MSAMIEPSKVLAHLGAASVTAGNLDEIGMPVSTLARQAAERATTRLLQAFEAQAVIAVRDRGRGWIGECVVDMLIAAGLEPDIYTEAYQLLARFVIEHFGLCALPGGESANDSAPLELPAPTPAGGSRWSSAHGSAEVLRSGRLRVCVPLTAGRNYVVTLPRAGGR